MKWSNRVRAQLGSSLPSGQWMPNLTRLDGERLQAVCLSCPVGPTALLHSHTSLSQPFRGDGGVHARPHGCVGAVVLVGESLGAA